MQDLLAEGSEDEEAGEGSKESEKYATFWKEFGRTIKLGVIEDAPNRPRLAKLLRVHTSAVGHPPQLTLCSHTSDTTCVAGLVTGRRKPG